MYMKYHFISRFIHFTNNTDNSHNLRDIHITMRSLNSRLHHSELKSNSVEAPPPHNIFEESINIGMK